MNKIRNLDFQRVAAISAIIAAPFSYLLTFTLLRAVSFDFTILATPNELIAIGKSEALVFKWTMLLDVIGQYFLLFPLVLFLWYWLRGKANRTVTLVTIGGVFYIFIGALGVSINAAVFPELMMQYADAGPEKRPMLKTVFTTFATATMVGMWGIFVRLVGGLYWVGIGIPLRDERMYVGYFTVGLGLVTLVSAIGNGLQIAPLIGVGTLGYLLGFPIWSLWLGVILYRNPAIAGVDSTDSATATVD